MYSFRNVILIVLICCIYSCNYRNKTSPADVVEIYFDYLQNWEFERAYNFLSDSLQQDQTQFAYRPKSVFGDWWKTCCFIKDFDIFNDTTSKNKKSKVRFILFDLTSWDKKEFVAELIEEEYEWKVQQVEEFNPLIDIEFKRLDTDITILINEADSLFKNKQLKEASRIYMELVDEYPFNAHYHAKLSYLLTLIAHKEKELWERGIFKYMPYAQSEYDIALQLQSNNITAHLAKGLNNYWTPGGYGDPQLAINSFEYILKQDSTNYIVNYYLKKLYKKYNIENTLTVNIDHRKSKIHQELLLIQ